MYHLKSSPLKAIEEVYLVADIGSSLHYPSVNENDKITSRVSPTVIVI